MTLQDLVLQLLDENGSISDTSAIHEDQIEMSGVLRSLESKEMVVFKQKEKERWKLTAEAQSIVENGSPEAMLYEAVNKSLNGLKISEIPVSSVQCCADSSC